jgi:hypothetical protein
MIGFVLRGMTGFGHGGGGGGLIATIVGTFVAVCTIWGFCKLAHCKLRDCSCLKRFLRCTGTDEFDDFDVMVLVHDVAYTRSSSISAAVRIRAGDQVAETDFSSDGHFQQPLSIFVEQGTQHIDVDFISSSKKVLATLLLDTLGDVIDPKEPVLQKVFRMKQKDKRIMNPMIKLSIHTEADEEAMTQLLGERTLNEETDVVLRQQLAKVHQKYGEDAENLSDLELLAKGCAGPVETFGSWGTTRSGYLNILGPPEEKKFKVCLWDSEAQARAPKKKGGGGGAPKLAVPVLRITSVLADPGRSDVFKITYVDHDKLSRNLVLRRLDRSRDAWTQLLQMLIEKVREKHQSDKQGRRRDDRSSEDERGAKKR